MSAADHEPVAAALRPVQRTAAYALLTDRAGEVLLVRASSRSDLPGRWFLPGGGLRHGEHPRDAVIRELAEETGLRARRATPRTATADVIDLPHRGVSVHTLRLIYDVRVEDVRGLDGVRLADVGLLADAGLRPERDGTSDQPRPVAPGELAGLALMPFVADLLGRPDPGPLRPAPPSRPEPLELDDVPEPRPVDPVTGPVESPDAGGSPAAGGSSSAGESPAAGGSSNAGGSLRAGGSASAGGSARAGGSPVRVQRPAAYAVLVDDSAGWRTGPRILLTRLSESRTPGRRGTWTLPGGGIDHGEHPLAALEREVYEETGLPYTAGPLLDIGSRHFVGRAPSGRLEDFHGLRLVYAGSVPGDLEPRVVEVGGSTDEAAWVPVADLGRITTVPAVRDSLATWTARNEHHRGTTPQQ